MPGNVSVFERFYVYLHVHPTTDKIMYVGYGSGGRGWVCSSTSRKNKDHFDWIRNLLKDGKTPDQFVTVVKRDLSMKEADELERKLIKQHQPPFNRIFVQSQTSLTKKQCASIARLRKRNVSYEKIAQRVGTTAMSVWRFVNLKKNITKYGNKNYV